jgi:hypothetical protein
MQSYSNSVTVKKPRKNDHSVNKLSKILVVSGIVIGVIVLTMSGINYLGTSYNHNSSESKMHLLPIQPDVIKTVKEIYRVDTLHSSGDVTPTYSNCLGNANGISLTITCPTAYGYVYKVIVDIPTGLISQFENKIFNLRELSIIEHVDSISIQYEKIIYEAKFVNR